MQAPMSNSSRFRNFENTINESKDTNRANAGQSLIYTNVGASDEPSPAERIVGPFPGSQLHAGNESYNSNMSTH